MSESQFTVTLCSSPSNALSHRYPLPLVRSLSRTFSDSCSYGFRINHSGRVGPALRSLLQVNRAAGAASSPQQAFLTRKRREYTRNNTCVNLAANIHDTHAKSRNSTEEKSRHALRRKTSPPSASHRHIHVAAAQRPRKTSMPTSLLLAAAKRPSTDKP